MPPTATLTATTAQAGPTRRLRLRGRVDAHVIADVDAQLASATDHDIDLDLTDVRFLDGAALATLEGQALRLRARGHALRVSAASTAVTVILELAAAAGVLQTDMLVPTPALGLAVAA